MISTPKNPCRVLLMAAALIALLFASSIGPKTAHAQRRVRPSQADDGLYPARRTRWRGPTLIKRPRMKLLATVYGDVHDPNGRPVPDDVIQDYDFSPDGKTLLCAYFPDQLIVWDAQTGVRKKRLVRPQHGFGALAYSPTEAMFVTAHGNLSGEGENRSIRFWDARTFQVIGRIDAAGYVLSLRFSPDGKTLAVVTDDENGNVQLWDVPSRKLKAVQLPKGHEVSEVAFSSDGSRLATAGKQAVEIWSTATAELEHTLQGNGQDVTSMSFSPNAQYLATTAGELAVWSVASGQQLYKLAGYTYATFFPDGSLVAGKSRADFYVLDPGKGSVVSKFPNIGEIRLSHNGQRAASYLFEELVVLRTWQLLK